MPQLPSVAFLDQNKNIYIMSINIKQLDNKNYLVNQKPVFKEKKKWIFSLLINEEEAKQFFTHLKTIKTNK